MRDHKKLRAFELADDLALEVYVATKAFPHEEQFGQTAQMRRAAVSVASNIVEGCARRSERGYLRFLDIAFASCHELEYQISQAYRPGDLAEDGHASLAAAWEETPTALNGLIRSFRHYHYSSL